ncbi:MAG: DUF86 domain-containing protein [Planctomycetes bacterium]|nr:DUF86 domain-containing protein [Planctomycetota bacterium]
MTDPLVVTRKVAALLDHVARLRRRRPATPELIRDDIDLQDAIGMSFVVAMQNAVDLALHVAASNSLGMPASTAESFRVLGARGLVPSELVEELVRMVALRNRIAHGYASVDFARVWSELPAGLDALERFAGLAVKLGATSRRNAP